MSEELATAAVNSVFGEGLNLRQHLEQLEEEEAQGGLAAGGWAGRAGARWGHCAQECSSQGGAAWRRPSWG